jgi:transcription-repair coupling factor (superfamily II helicase)
MKLIGVDLYQHLLEFAVREAKGETVEDWVPVLNLGVSGRLSPDWIPDEDIRLGLYVRLSRITDLEGLEAFEDELADRFGEPPDKVQQLLATTRVRILARTAHIAKVDSGPAAMAFTPHANFVAREEPDDVKLSNGRLLLKQAIDDPAERLTKAEAVLSELLG